MATPFQQKARLRKVIYLGLIVVLFTVSLLHRRLIVERQAENLQLREAARGEVELTSSFVRLSLTGSRGLATTILWSTAMDRMAKHEWNELELLVNSISTLQPYFITPWVFQSWNLAFNVAVECDRPHDKYYYVSRGLQLLAEGERRNQGTGDNWAPGSGQPKFPGNPEMRYYMGFYLQLKIGNSDEKNTMRSLFDLSCIDPVKRRPERFRRGQGADAQIDSEKLKEFCQHHPRLVRRLREQLGYDSPDQIVRFLQDNKDVPNRFKKLAVADQPESELEEPRKQFPVLPPVAPREASVDGPAWPKPTYNPMSTEAVDVFLVCRTWYQYAQEPLPPPLAAAGVTRKEQEYQEKLARLRKEENINYRPAKTMAIEIFRGYPSRAQMYIAENLEAEGWFDEDGWLFDQGGGESLRVGTETKYHAGPAWHEAYRMYLRYGRDSGLYMSPAELADLEAKAEPARVKLKLSRFQYPPMLPTAARESLGEAYDAQQQLGRSLQSRSMSNYDAHLYAAEGEKDPQTILARKLTFQALQHAKKGNQEAKPLFTQAWPLWIDVWLRYPDFNQVAFVQDDIYEAMLHYLRLCQRSDPQLFQGALVNAAEFATLPTTSWSWQPYYVGARAALYCQGGRDGKDQSLLTKVAPAIRIAEGPLAHVAFYNGRDAKAVRDFWFGATFTAARLGQIGFAPPVFMPSQVDYTLAGAIWDRQATPPTDWLYLISPDVARSVRQRLGLLATPRETPAAPPEAALHKAQPPPGR